MNFNLIQKYNKPGPRYTSYPPATFFHNGLTNNDYQNQIKQSNNESTENISFYFHVPFCPQLCHFCGCNTGLMREKSFVERYFNALKKEFEQVAALLDKTRPVTQIHWGGGTPNSVNLKYIAEVMDLIRHHFKLSAYCEVAMECNPAYLSFNQIDELNNAGFNRISIGIQDFNKNVLEIINRKPSQLPIKDLVIYLKDKGMQVNLDFVYGLPGQSADSFEATIHQALAAKPDRIVTFSYAHVPWVKEAQKILEQYSIPAAEEKLNMFDIAYQLITSNGYEAIGLDHFARPDDEMTLAQNSRTLHRNFMGYCTQRNTGQVYAFGSTAITQLTNAYFQNSKDTEAYILDIEQNGFAVAKGYIMTIQDKVCSEVIQQLMCNYFIDLENIATHFSLKYEQLIELLGFDANSLTPFIQDGLVEWHEHKLQIMSEGRIVLRNVAMLFDPQQNSCNKHHYSNTI